jgi:glycosyltransferase involved in cell wall biosynthesis
MKVLQLSYRLPVPPKDGGAIGIWHLLKAYAALGHAVHFIGFNTDKHYLDPSLAREQLAPYVTQADFVYLKTTPSIIGALKSLIKGESYHISRFVNTEMEQQIVRVLQSQTFDLIHLDGIFMAPYIECIRKHSKAQIILRAHNIEFKIWEGLADAASGLKRIYLKHLANQLKAYELKAWSKADVVAAINLDELGFIQNYQKTYLLEAGWFTEEATIQTSSRDFFHIGSMEWIPNKVGLQWFLQNIWPPFVGEHPEAKLHLAGRGLEQNEILPKGVINHGEVESAKVFMQTYGTMLVPLFHGAGVRIKLIEAFSIGIPTISSDKGIEGLNACPNSDFLQANTIEEWLVAMNMLYQNEQKRNEIQQNARKFAVENLSQIKLLESFLNSISV